ncbi:MAG: hypothetical protein LBS98_02730 [Coriobacteriales bacterium]|jgi:hypothetical protein|nr:hypothetical protein [Coriobacteriales bacterium]
MQKPLGLNDPFDATFKGTIDGIGIITGSREGADSRKFTFSANGHEYVIWLWKGDYIGLGAGAEMGLYFDPIAGQHWQSSEDTRMN